MEVDGREFLRNVNIEQDKLDREKKESIKKSPDYFEPEDDGGVYVDLSVHSNKKDYTQDDLGTMPNENILRDIVLNPDATNKNKKKYIILGFALIILFILTIVIIRVVSNSNTQKELEQASQPTQTIANDSKLDKIETQKEFKDLVVPPELPKEQPQPKQDLILPEPIKEKPPVEIIPTKPAQQAPADLFGIQNNTQNAQEPEATVTKKEVKKTEPAKKVEPVKTEPKKVQPQVKDEPKRKQVVPPPSEINFVKNSKGKLQGYYIQVGAFSKKPADSFLSKLSKKGYNYTIHTVDIKGKIYNKVLIGPYPSKGVATKNLPSVQQDSNNKNAYILKF